MANYTNLINGIKAVIKQNGTNDITGQLMQDTLTTIVGTIGRFATFAGVAVPSTNPNNPDQTVFYLATQVGTYVNFGGLQISGTRICAIHNISGAWALEVIITLTDGTPIEIDPALDANSVNPVENRAVYAECQAIRALISGLTPAQTIKQEFLTVAQAEALNGHTYMGKIVLACNFQALGVYSLTYFNPIQIAAGNLYMTQLRTGNSYADISYVTLTNSVTLADIVGVSHSIQPNNNWVIYAE